MTVETPPSGTPGLAGRGHELDRAAATEAVWLRALSGLTAELRSCGLEARMDGVVGAVDAIAYGPARRTQRAVLRPHRGQLWWWLRWSPEVAASPETVAPDPAPDAPAPAAPHHTPLTPASEAAAAARRIVRVLEPGSGGLTRW